MATPNKFTPSQGAEPRQILIIHGWSDTSKSFRALANFLDSQGYAVRELWLGDYISLDDDVRVADVAKRMAEVIDQLQLTGELNAHFDVIVHSTGGLVARAWLTSTYAQRAHACPMKRLIMLAPANHGSKLAAMGKSFLGRVVKGYNNWFHTGQAILNDLELASDYQWELAQRDLLVGPKSSDSTAPSQYYYEAGVWPFVITGTHSYTNFLRQIVNENGADGTVRACAANLQAQGMTIDFRETEPAKAMTIWPSRLQAAVPFAVLSTRTHGSIIDPDRAETQHQEDIAETDAEKAQLGELILQALACPNFDEYQRIGQAWQTITEETAQRAQATQTQSDERSMFHQYFQINSAVIDDQGKAVQDYFLEFFAETNQRNTESNVYMHGSVMETVKTNSLDTSLRNMYFDYTDLMNNYYKDLPKNTPAVLNLSISAASPGANINYFVREKVGAEMHVPLHFRDASAACWLQKNATHYIHIIIPRIPNKDVFRLTRALS